MPQNPLSAVVAKSAAGPLAPLNLDAAGNLLTSAGDTKSLLNQIAAVAVKAAPGRLAKVLIVAGGTASNGSFVFNDCLTVGAATAANEVIAIPSGTTAGTVITLDWPFAVGIVMSAVPSAGSPIASISYT